VYSVDFHPDGTRFIASSATGDVRLFDLRKIVEADPNKSFLNIYRNISSPAERYEMTGCMFSKDGTGIVASALNDYIYHFDTTVNFEKQYGYTYLQPSRPAQPQRQSRQQPERRPDRELVRASLLRFIGERQPELLAALDTELFLDDHDEDNEDPEGVAERDVGERNGLDRDSDRESRKEEEEENTSPVPGSPVPVETYLRKYEGHCSVSTIKGVNFYGPNSEYVMSGSDDACIYIWERKSGKLVRILEGHKNIVNCVIWHPSSPLIASSGIDNIIKLWDSVTDIPSEEEIIRREKKKKERTEANATGQRQDVFRLEDVCTQQ